MPSYADGTLGSRRCPTCGGRFPADFRVCPRDAVALSEYVGRQVQLSAIVVDPDHKDAEVKIEDKTTVDPAYGSDRTNRSKAKVEVGRGAYGGFTVVSVKPLGSPCR